MRVREGGSERVGKGERGKEREGKTETVRERENKRGINSNKR